MMVCHVLIGVFFVTEHYVVLYAAILVFVCSFQLTSGCITFVYLGEVCVDAGMGFVQAGLFAFNILMAFTISFLIDSQIGVSGTFWMYAGLNLLASVFIAVFIKETRGKNPAELKALYSSIKRVKSYPSAKDTV